MPEADLENQLTTEDDISHQENTDSGIPNRNDAIGCWNAENEDIIVRWCDTAQCYRWLCHESHKKYAHMQASFSIPTIIMSTIIGAASFSNISNNTLLSNYSSILPLAIGSVNIMIGVLNTIQQYYKISEFNENFRICALAWDKFERFLSLELSKAPWEREVFNSFFRKATSEFDRLMENTPMIQDHVIREFNRTFDKNPAFSEIQRPPILDVIVSSNKYRHGWYIKNKNNKPNSLTQ